MKVNYTNVVRIEIKKSKPTELDEQTVYHWVAIAGNDEIVAHGETHGSQRDALRAAAGVFGSEIPTYDLAGNRYQPAFLRTLLDEINPDWDDSLDQ